MRRTRWRTRRPAEPGDADSGGHLNRTGFEHDSLLYSSGDVGVYLIVVTLLLQGYPAFRILHRG